MKSPHYFIIEPKDGVLYDNKVEVGDGKELITSTSIENHKVTNRQAKVLAVPTTYEGPIIAGDNIIVHHNVFRKEYNMKGKEQFSSNLIKDNIYRAYPDEVFAFKSEGAYWVPVEGFCFVKPVVNTDDMHNGAEQQLHGELVYLGADLMDDGLKRGDMIIFKPISEYEFNIDGEKLYRVKTKSVCLILN